MANEQFRTSVTSFVYTAAGGVSSLRLGNGRFENTQFNSRLQPIQIGLGSSATTQNLLKLNFDYGAGDNNGNIKSQTITVPTVGTTTGFTAVQTYTYDSLNRIKQADEKLLGYTQAQCDQNPSQCWKQTFTYDRYGNRNFDTNAANTTTIPVGCAVAVCNPTVDVATNRLVGYQFDNAGNTKTDAENRTFIYDGENKQVEVKDAYGTSVGKYFYDGDGKRVKKISLTETTLFIYNAAGQLIAEYSMNISQTPQTTYTTTDHLGSPRISTNAAGQVISRHDYQPFGEEIARTNYGADDVRKKFTGYEKDTETDLDYAQARMYANNLGRFSSPDPLLSTGRPDSPQTWNKFSYVLNNPLILTDPTGMYLCSAGKTNCEKFEASLQERRNNLEKIKDEYGEDSDEYKNAKASVDVYGNKDEDNGVTILLANKNSRMPKEAGAKTEVEGVRKKITALNREGKSIRVTITQNTFDGKYLGDAIVHEGSHAADGAQWVGCNFCLSKNPTEYEHEFKGYLVGATFAQARVEKLSYNYDPQQIKGTPKAFGSFQLWNPSWKSVDESKPQIDFFLKHSEVYNKTPNDKVFIKGARF